MTHVLMTFPANAVRHRVSQAWFSFTRRATTPTLILLALLALGCRSWSPVTRPTTTDCLVEFNSQSIEQWRGDSGPFESMSNHQLAVDFFDASSVLRFVLQSSPETVAVYPSERYYYYRFPLGGRLVSGNIRFVDVEAGAISVGYFDAFNQADLVTAQFHSGHDGIHISLSDDDRRVELRLDGLRRIFVLDREAFETPTFALLEGEQWISGIRDESGYFLHLIYWKPGRSFYYVLNPAKPLPEKWSRGGSSKLETWFGDRSRFCFVRHPNTGRLILVGVHRREIMLNTWYDGPFDQVPPRLPIGDILREAYPYVADAGGIDEHGNFLNLSGQRVAISPYRDYDSGPALEAELENLIKPLQSPEAWIHATYEPKRDWRSPARFVGQETHNRPTSATWPANHWGHSSRAWGAQHDGGTSLSWPPNHAVDQSTSADTRPNANQPSTASPATFPR